MSGKASDTTSAARTGSSAGRARAAPAFQAGCLSLSAKPDAVEQSRGRRGGVKGPGGRAIDAGRRHVRGSGDRQQGCRGRIGSRRLGSGRQRCVRAAAAAGHGDGRGLVVAGGRAPVRMARAAVAAIRPGRRGSRPGRRRHEAAPPRRQGQQQRGAQSQDGTGPATHESLHDQPAGANAPLHSSADGHRGQGPFPQCAGLPAAASEAAGYFLSSFLSSSSSMGGGSLPYFARYLAA